MKAINKDILKEVKESKGRFLSILIMVTIGVLVFVGLKVTGPIMIGRGDKFLDDSNAADIVVKSSLEMDKEDLDIITGYKNTKDYEKVFQKDFYNGKKVIKISSLNEKISKPILVEGNLPTKDDEILLNVNSKEKYKIGDIINLKKEDRNPYGFEDEEDKEYALKNYKYKVCGFAKSPKYVDTVDLGSTDLGVGTVEEVGFILKSNFTGDKFASVDIILKDVPERSFESESYSNLLKESRSDIENLLIGRRTEIYENQRSEITDKIQDGEKEIQEARDKIKDGRDKLNDASNKVKEGYDTYEKQKDKYEKALVENKKQLDDARLKLNSEKPKLTKGKKEIEDAKKKLDKAKEEIDKGKAELDKAKAEYDSNVKKVENGFNEIDNKENEIKNGISQIDSAILQIEEGKNKLPQLQSQLDQARQAKSELEAGINSLKAGIAQVSQGIADIDSQIKALEGNLDPQNPDDAIKAQIEALKQQKEKLIFQKNDLESQLPPLEAKLTQVNQGISQLESAISMINGGQAKIEELKSKKSQALAGLEQLKQERTKLQSAKDSLSKGKRTLEEKEAEFQKGLKEYEDNLAKWEKEKKKFDDGEAKFKSSEKILNDNLALYEKGKAEGQAQLDEALKKLQSSEKEIRDNEKELDDKEKEAEEEIAKAQTKLDDARRFLKILLEPQFSVVSRDSDAILYNFFDEASRLEIISNVFPVFFFFIAILVSLTTMTRMVEEQRIQIGTLKALGYSNISIIKKYFIYGGIASIVGSILGVILGHKLISPIIFSAYASHYVFESGNIPYNLKYSILSIAIGVLCTTFAGVIVTTNSLRENAASLLRPKPPKSGVRILLERFGFIWKRLSFMQKVTMRNLFRYKRRMLMTVIGISGCTGLIFMGFGIRDSLSSVLEKQYSEIYKYDTIAVYNEDLSPNAFKEYKELLKDTKKIKNSKSIYIDNLACESKKGPDQQITLIVPENTTDLKDFIKLRNRKTKNTVNLKKDSVVINEKLAKLYDINIGDEIDVKTEKNKHYKLKIGGISELYAGHNMYMPRDYYEKIFEENYETNADLIILQKDKNGNTNDLLRQISDNKSVVSIINIEKHSDIFDALIGSLNMVVFVIITFACILAFVVLYNLTNINVSERLRELSTIKVLGFYDKEVTAYIYRETLLLTILGILLGYFIGYLMHLIIIERLIPDSAMLDPQLRVSNFLLSGIITLIFAVIVMFVIHNKLKKVDMVEALKAIE